MEKILNIVIRPSFLSQLRAFDRVVHSKKMPCHRVLKESVISEDDVLITCSRCLGISGKRRMKKDFFARLENLNMRSEDKMYILY